MQISVWYIVVAAILFFAFGVGLTIAIDAHLVRHCRKCAKAYMKTLDMLQRACRVTLSDAWYRKVIRRFQDDFEKDVREAQEEI